MDFHGANPGGGMSEKIKVLVVDDSAIVRKILSDAIDAEKDMEVVGTAPDPYVARDKIVALRPDVLTLDIEMPRMDGLTFLKRLMKHCPTPTIIISSLGQASGEAALEALRCGAVEVMCKPMGPYSVGDLRFSLASKIRAAACAKKKVSASIHSVPASRPVEAVAASTPAVPSAPAAPAAPIVPIAARFARRPETVIAIGASTGGTVAIQELLTRLPADMPGIVITQHIPEGFSLMFAKRLNTICSMEVKEAVTGDVVRPGTVLIAPGNHHMLLRRNGADYTVELQQGPQVCYQRPSVDVMFASVAQVAGAHALGVLLTGMGADGAKGLLAMKRAGAPTIAQDEESCVVYGMPREAVRLGAVDTVASLLDIPKAIADGLQKSPLSMARAV